MESTIHSRAGSPTGPDRQRGGGCAGAPGAGLPRCCRSKTMSASAAGVRKGIDQADQGMFIDEAEMEARISQILSNLMRLRWTPAAADDLESIGII